MKGGAFFFLFCLVMAGTGLSQKMTVKDSDANVLMEVNDEGTVGSITVPAGSAPSTPTNKLYNVGGSLYWNGSALVTGGAGGWTSGTGKVYTTTLTDKVGLNTSTPEFKLSLDKDGGILAKGKLDSGAVLSTSGEGTRLIWYPRKAAFRAGYVYNDSWDDANIGAYSVAMGYRTKASGDYSTALGFMNNASGVMSTAMGCNNSATGYAATVLGNATEAEAYCSVAIGQYNVGGGAPNYWSGSDPVFEIGIGEGGMIEPRKNAMTVLQNGNVGIGTVTPGYPLEVAGQVKITGGTPGAGKVLTSDASGLASWQTSAVSGGWTKDADKVYTTTASDKVGIGTTAPQFKLTVEGDGGVIAKGIFGGGADLGPTGSGTRMVWYPKKAAFRAGYVDGDQWDDTNVGEYSVSMGVNTKASGNKTVAMGAGALASGTVSTAMGDGTIASGIAATAMGYHSEANGIGSTAIGGETTAGGYYSTAMGYSTTADAYSSVAVGQYNVGGGTPGSWDSADPVFEIGNGTSAIDKANALTVLKNGKVGIGTATPGYPLEVTGQVKITGGSPGAGKVLTSDASGLASWQTSAASGGWTGGTGKVYTTTASDKVGIGTSTPQFKLTVEGDGGVIAKGIFGEGADLGPTGSGTRMVWYPKKAAFRAGYVDGDQWDDGNVGEYSVSMGINTKASGNKSVAMGAGALASGTVSTAMGDGTIASGIAATAMGYHSEANGIGSTAIGGETTAGGYYSTAMGYSTTADAYSSVAVGQYNVGGGTPGSWDSADPVFEIGNGTSAIDKANALTVLKNGKVGIGTATPGYPLEVTGQVKITGGSPGAGKVLTSDASGLASWQTSAASGGWTSETGKVYTTTSTDKVGIGTSTPQFKLTVEGDGGIIAKGTHGTGADLGAPGAGTRLTWHPKKAAFRAGFVDGTQWDDPNVGDFSVAMGYSVEASNSNSIAMGYGATASGLRSIAMGHGVTASGDHSIAMNYISTASGDYSVSIGWSTTASATSSTAMGSVTEASGDVSTTMGRNTTAGSYADVAMGRYNVGGGTADSWVATDPIFEIGIGTDNSNRKNAVTVLKNGNVGVGTTVPGYPLEVTGQVKITGGSPGAGKVLSSDASGLASWQSLTSAAGWTSETDKVYTTTASDKVGIGLSIPTSQLDVAGDIETGDGNSFYFGDPSTDGSWRLVRSFNDLVFQRRVSGIWVTKGSIAGS